MTDYRPWEIHKPAREKGPETEPEAEKEAPTEAPGEAKPEPPANPEDLERTKVTMAPGMGEAPVARGDGGRRLAATSLLATGGLLFIGAWIFLIFVNMAISIDVADGHGGNPDSYTIRAIGLTIGLVGSALPLAAGLGALYGQPWSKPLGFFVAGLQIVSIIGILFGALTIGGLASWRPR